MKYFVVSDIHSYYDEFMDALRKAQFDVDNSEHIIISLGDNWDRGNKPIEVMEFLLEMYEKKRAILIRGNHEDLLMEALNRKIFYMYDEQNGTVSTYNKLARYCDADISRSKLDNNMPNCCQMILKNKTIKRFLDAMIDYYELDEYVFTHGFIPISLIWGVPEYNPKWKLASKKEWEKARYYNGIELAYEYNIKIPDKTIVIGHYHASYGNARKKYGFNNPRIKDLEFSDLALFEPFVEKGIIAIDSCVAYTRRINCYVIEKEDK